MKLDYIGKPRAKAAAIAWLKRNDPFLYQAAVGLHAKKSKGGLGLMPTNPKVVEQQEGFWSSIIDTVKNVAPTLIAAKQSRDIMKMQMQRASKGLPPMEAKDYQPSIRIDAGMSPELQAQAQQIGAKAFDSIKPVLLGVAALLAFTLYKKRR